MEKNMVNEFEEVYKLHFLIYLHFFSLFSFPYIFSQILWEPNIA